MLLRATVKPLQVTAEQCAKIFRVIGEDTRFRILKTLLSGERCVNDLVRLLKVSQPHVSHHLRILRQCGLVEGTREGQRICYRVSPGILERLPIPGEEALELGCCRISFTDLTGAGKK